MPDVTRRFVLIRLASPTYIAISGLRIDPKDVFFKNDVVCRFFIASSGMATPAPLMAAEDKHLPGSRKALKKNENK